MGLIIADRVRETSTTSGTGALTLAGAVTGFQRFSAVCSVGDEVQYVRTEGALWEVSVGVYSGTNTITRSYVLNSSNSGSAVSFTGASSDVVLTMPAVAAKGISNRNKLINSGMQVWQRTDPATYTTLADKGMGPDGWFVLSESGNIQVKKDTTNSGLDACILKQNHGSSQRYGIGQVLFYEEGRTGFGDTLWFQAEVQLSSTANLKAAVLEWTGTRDAADRDFVNNWASTTYAAGSFFHSSWSVVALYQPSASSLFSVSTLATSLSKTGNIGVFIWMPDQISNGQTTKISAPILSESGVPQRYNLPNYSDELAACLARYTKTFGLTTVPVQNIGNAQGALRATGNGSGVDIDWRFPVPMRKIPICTTFNTLAANANWRDQTAGADRTATLGTATTSAVVINAGSTTSGNQMSIHATAEAEPCS